MLIETSGSHGGHDEEKINTFLERTMANGHVQDGTVTNEPSKMSVSHPAPHYFQHIFIETFYAHRKFGRFVNKSAVPF